jgi:hypothetical protein
MNDPATAKLKMLQASIHCLVYGLLAFLPGIGLPFAIAALVTAGSVRNKEKQFWNAAKPYRMIGVACAALGTTGWLIIAVLIAAAAISRTSE